MTWNPTSSDGTGSFPLQDFNFTGQAYSIRNAFADDSVAEPEHREAHFTASTQHDMTQTPSSYINDTVMLTDGTTRPAIQHRHAYPRHGQQGQTAFDDAEILIDLRYFPYSDLKLGLVYEPRPTDMNVESVVRGPWYHDRRVVVSIINGDEVRWLRGSNYLPPTIQSDIRGYLLEIWQTLDLGFQFEDVLDRMPDGSPLFRRPTVATLRNRIKEDKKRFVVVSQARYDAQYSHLPLQAFR